MCQVKLHLKSNNLKLLTNVEKFIKKAIGKTKTNISLLSIMHKTNIKRVTVLKSPHVHKKSREQFQFTEYHQLILIKQTSSKQILKVANCKEKPEHKVINFDDQMNTKFFWSHILFPILKSDSHYGVQLKTSVYHCSFLK